MSHSTKTPNFPVNTSWSVAQPYRPREVPDAIKNMLAETLIRNDNAVRQLLRQCKDKWIFAVTLGHDTLGLKVYDPAEVDDISSPARSSSINRARTSFFEIDRNMTIRQLDSDRIDAVMTTHPMIYADRGLKSNEISTCDSIVRSMTGEVDESGLGEKILKDLPTWDEVVFDRPEFTLEPTTTDDTP